jgi:hypothetical protein
LPEIGVYEIMEKGQEPLGGGRWAIYAYADNEAITALIGAGMTVDIVVPESVIVAQRLAMTEYLTKLNTGIV